MPPFSGVQVFESLKSQIILSLQLRRGSGLSALLLLDGGLLDALGEVGNSLVLGLSVDTIGGTRSLGGLLSLKTLDFLLGLLDVLDGVTWSVIRIPQQERGCNDNLLCASAQAGQPSTVRA